MTHPRDDESGKAQRFKNSLVELNVGAIKHERAHQIRENQIHLTQWKFPS